MIIPCLKHVIIYPSNVIFGLLFYHYPQKLNLIVMGKSTIIKCKVYAYQLMYYDRASYSQ